ncbi:MAG: hypothetical protein ABEJ40_06385 [Haloarculaceae archaeon]
MADKNEPDDRMRERVPGSSLKLWLLLGAGRWLVAALTLGVVGAGVAVVLRVDPAPLRGAVEAADPVETLFQALLTAIVTGVTLVVSINSLVLSQELGAVGDQRERMSASMTFRGDVADELGVPASPPEPSAFLRSLVELTGERAERFRDAAGVADGTVRERVDGYVDDLTHNSSDVADRLDGAQFGTFEVVFAALDFNYSWKVYEARRLRGEHGDELGDEALGALNDLIDALRLFGPAREHVKTLYFQWELIDLSRAMLYSAVPALVVSVGGILALDNPGSVPGSTAGVANLGWVTLAATLVALAPFAVLLSYVLRIATVAKRTLAIGPFVLRETDRTDDIDWGE